MTSARRPRSLPRAAAAHLFAYGTLMRGFPLHTLLGEVEPLGRGHVKGRLLRLRHYPGLVEAAARVRGEVYRLRAPEVLSAIDRAEGYNFERRLTTVTLASGRRLRAWTYWYRGSQHRAAVIPDGDWRIAWRSRPRS